MKRPLSIARRRRLRRVLALALALLPLFLGCSATARHQALTVFFNTVPSFPESGEYCEEYQADKESAAARVKTVTVPVNVSHLPYEEKRCPDCHSEQKDTGGGLVLPREKLCFKCHPDILEHGFVHGPAAEGDCLACHLPHSSSNKALLAVEREKLCGGCHTERRVASAMHDRLSQKGLFCMDCHDPHSGTSQYFLK